MELGFWFAPPEYPHAPGSPEMSFNIYDRPTEQHFDPEEGILSLVSDSGFPERTSITHPCHLKDRYHVYPGYVILFDRKGKQERAYTFGGTLKVKCLEMRSQCSLQSTAPIIYVQEKLDLPSRLAGEVEILFAERAAAWLPDQDGYERRRASVSPEILYPACLKTLLGKYSAFENPDLDWLLGFENFLRNEIAALKKHQRWPGEVPELEEIL
jgi:hypothetical protein